MLSSNPCSCFCLQGFEPLAQLLESRVCRRVPQPRGELDLDLLGLLLGVRVSQHRFEQVGVQNQGVEIVADRST